MISTQSRSTRRGFSLIEVAIALVIFVIGALAIVRIFPGALKVIGNNGNQQIAMNLNRDVAARLKSDDSVPSATFNVAVSNAGALSWTSTNADHTADYADIPASVIGIPRFNMTLPTTENINTQSGNSALSRFRGIIGEQAKVIKIGTDYYVTTQFPISLEKANGGTNDTLLAPTISQEYIVQNARIDKDRKVTFENATTDVNGQQVSLTDAANNTTKNVLPVGSIIYVGYRYYNSAGKVWGVKEEAIPVTANLTLRTDNAASPVFVTVNPPTTTRGAYAAYVTANPTVTGTVAEVVDVRVKRYADVGSFGTGTMVEQTTNARCGLVKLPFTPTTTTVSLDYVADWSWLMQKGNPLIASDSAADVHQLALGAPFIEDQAPVAIYSLLISSSNPPTLLGSQFGTANPTPAAANGLVAPTQDELRNGRVSFSGTDSSTKARVAYRTRDSWVQQLAVAADAYKPFVANNAEPWRDYVLGDDNYLYFHAGEAGKTISISYTTNEGTNGTAIVERPFVIDNQIIDTPATVATTFAASGKVSRVQLTNYAGNILAPADLVSIQGIAGKSVTVRTAYINGDKYAQTLLTSNRGTN